jgi:hypothetical protein
MAEAAEAVWVQQEQAVLQIELVVRVELEYLILLAGQQLFTAEAAVVEMMAVSAAVADLVAEEMQLVHQHYQME